MQPCLIYFVICVFEFEFMGYLDLFKYPPLHSDFVVIWYMSSLIHPLCKQFIEKGNIISILCGSTAHFFVDSSQFEVSSCFHICIFVTLCSSNPRYFYQFQIAPFESRVRRQTVWHLTHILICIFLEENLWLEEIKLKKHRASAGSTYGKINLWVSSLCCSCQVFRSRIYKITRCVIEF